MKTIETKRLRLRKAKLGDITTIYDAAQFEGFNDGMGWDPPSEKEELHTPHQRNLEAWEKGHGYAFSIDLKEIDQMVGRITIRRTKERDVWNIGFWTHPNFQKKGIMKEAVEEVVSFGFTGLMAARIEADYALWNIGSEKVLLSNGFVLEGEKEKGFLKKGQWVAIKFVGLNKEDWIQTKNSI